MQLLGWELQLYQHLPGNTIMLAAGWTVLLSEFSGKCRFCT
jgi:hypothetical protein